MNNIIILDLDNTISDDGWRIPRINWDKKCPLERYHKYHSSAIFDDCKNKHLFENKENEYVIFTARPILYRAQTVKWLCRNNIDYSALYMRENDDHCHSLELKRNMLAKLLDDFNKDIKAIKHAYDDRHDVINMFKEIGVPATQIQIHSICAYTAPKVLR